MPVACITLEETNRTILSSSYFKVIQEVLAQTNIPYGTLVAMHKGMEVNRTDNQSNLSSVQPSNLPSTTAQRKVVVDITEEYNEDALSTTAVSYQDTTPIFMDAQIDLKVYPVYVTSDITLKISFTTPSKTEANRLRDDLRIKLSQMRNIIHHEVQYDILVPEVVQDLIADVHTLKNRLYPSELGEYFRQCATKQAHLVTDLVGMKNAQLAIRERQVRIVGRFEFTSMPEAVEEDRESNTYRLSIPYKFTMEVPRGMCMSYPPMVCNRPLPSKYLQWIADAKIKTREEYSRNLTYTSSLGALSHFEAHRQLDYRLQNKRPLNLPLWDEFPVRRGCRGYVITTTFLSDVNEEDRRTLFNLRELPDFYMDSDLLAFLASGERLKAATPYQSLFYFGLHYPGKYYDKDVLEITPDLTVRSKVDLPLDKTIRVSLGVCIDLVFFDREMRKRWWANRPMLVLYLRELIEVMRDYKDEFSFIEGSDIAYYDFLIGLLSDGYAEKDLEFLQSVTDLISSDPMTMDRLCATLRIRAPALHAGVCRLTGLCRLQSDSAVRNAYAPSDVKGYVAKTVMTAYVQTHKLESLS